MGASIPIRLDPGYVFMTDSGISETYLSLSYYSVRTPKLDCQLKFTSKMGLTSDAPMDQRAQDDAILLVSHQIV